MQKRKIKLKNPNNFQMREYAEAVEVSRKSHHVMKSGGVWVVKKAGASRVSKKLSSQKEAIRYASEIARKNNSFAFIHNSEGEIIRRVG